MQVNRIQLGEVGYRLHEASKIIEELEYQLKRSVDSLNNANNAEELKMFADIFDGTAMKCLVNLKNAIDVWSLKFESISQVYYTVQKECYRKIMDC